MRRQHHTALTGRHVFRRIKAEGRRVAKGADTLPPVHGAVRLRTVLDQQKVVLPDKRQNRIHIAGLSKQMHNQNRFDLWIPGQLLFHFVNRNIKRFFVNVRKHWRSARIKDSVGGGNKRKRRSQNLIPGTDAQRANSHLQRSGSRGRGYTIFCPCISSKLLFELFNDRTAGDHTAVNHFADGFLLLRPHKRLGNCDHNRHLSLLKQINICLIIGFHSLSVK